MRVCTQALSCKAQDNFYVVGTDACDVRIYFLSPEIVRIRAGFDGTFQEYSYSLVMTAWDSVTDPMLKAYRRRVEVAPSTLEEQPDCFVLTSSALKVIVHKSPFEASHRLTTGDSPGPENGFLTK